MGPAAVTSVDFAIWSTDTELLRIQYSMGVLLLIRPICQHRTIMLCVKSDTKLTEQFRNIKFNSLTPDDPSVLNP